jgi:TonB-linked SusC/RagA family outer membrane protein
MLRPLTTLGKYLLTLIFLGSISIPILAQQDNTLKRVSGTVKDSTTGQPLKGVVVSLSGVQASKMTGDNGKFEIDARWQDTLAFSHVGFNSVSIVVGGSTTINVSLQREAKELEDVVVVGYGTIKKSDLTGSVTKLTVKDFNPVATSIDEMIAGKAPGVLVVQNTGEPGGGMATNIRGVGSITGGTTPLYVIDGLPIDNSPLISESGNQVVTSRSPRNPLSSLSPSDIASVEILKDASATAIYGSRGANGVILITTKRGVTGPIQVSYTGTVGIQNVHRRLDLLNAEEFKEGINAIIDAGAGDPLDKVTDIINGGTDWQDVVYREDALSQTHNLNLSGGNGKGAFLVALNHSKQNGLVKGSSFDMYGARVNLNHNGDKFKMGFNGNFSYIKDNYIPYGFDVGIRAGVISSMKSYDPTQPLRDADGNYVSDVTGGGDNPAVVIEGSHITGNRYRFSGIFYSEYFILPKLSARVNIGSDISNDDKSVYKDRTTAIGLAQGGLASLYNGMQSNYLFEGLLRFEDEIAKGHRLSVVGGATAQKFVRYNSETHGTGFPTDATTSFNFALADRASLVSESYKSANQLLSYFGRANYNLLDKYLLTATFRMDGSSRFGEQNRFGYFPSLSVGWQIHQEKFFKSLASTVNMLKLRTSWGQTGNQDIGNYTSLSTYASINPDIYVGTRQSYVLNNQLITTLNPLRIPNPDLKWETTTQYNVGLDFGLWNNRITGSIEWYRKITDDMLIDLPVPSESGFNKKLSNIGSMSNRGFEFSVTSNNLRTKHFNWKSDLNFATLKNNLTSLGSINSIITGSMTSEHSNVALITPGSPVWSYYGYEVIGIWQEGDDFSTISNVKDPGHFKFRDVDKNGIINSNDRVNLGNSFPKLTWGFGNTVSYKNFSLYFFFQGVSGLKMFNGTLLETYWPRGGRLRANRLSEPFVNRWTPDNPTNDQPSFVKMTTQSAQAINSKTVVDASYAKLQTVRLSYDLSKRVLKKQIRTFELYLTGQNLITFSDYNGFDPALNPNGNSFFRIDWNGYPSARSYVFGVNIGF